MRRTTLVAHRGRAGQGPENSIEAISGLPPWVDGVEVDARLNAEGIPVLMHDRTVDRTTDGTGEVEALSWSTLTALRVAGGGRVPTLAAYLDAATRTWLDPILVDVKTAHLDALDAVVSTVGSAPVASRCVLLVRSERQLERLRELDRPLRAALLGLSRSNAGQMFSAAETFDAEFLLLRPGDEEYLRSRSLVTEGRSRGVEVGASTINSDAALRAAYADGCTLVLTDRTTEYALVAKR